VIAIEEGEVSWRNLDGGLATSVNGDALSGSPRTLLGGDIITLGAATILFHAAPRERWLAECPT